MALPSAKDNLSPLPDRSTRESAGAGRVLVALSSSLQRERTAIKLLLELMAEHIDDLRPGDLVGLGDLFDAVRGPLARG